MNDMRKPVTDTSSPWLVNLGARDGAKIRLICAHHAGGSSRYFEAWPDALPPHVEAIGVNLPGRGSRRSEPLVRDLDTVVASIVSDLEKYLDRPFAMFGDSIGALVCFEVIRALRRQGKPLPVRLFASGMVAPHIVWWNPEVPMHKMTDEALFQGLVRDAGMLDEKSLADADLRDVMIPVVRADLEIAETYVHQPESPLAVPITALRGDQDILLSPDQLEGWSRHTSLSFEHLTMPGNHFYSRSNRAKLLDLIASRIGDDLKAVPLSLAEGAAADYPRQGMHDVFAEQAKRTPDAIALVYRDVRYSYAALDRITSAMARWLAAKGIGKGDMVGIMMERCDEHVVAIIAINKAGAAFMPLETAYPPETLRRFASLSGAKLFLTKSRWLSTLPDDIGRDFAWAAMDDGWSGILGIDDYLASNTPLPVASAGDMAFMSMSSGTSGAPKGICQSHGASLNAYWHRYVTAPYGADEREACNVYFIWYVWLPLLQGAAAYVVPDDVIYDPGPFSTFIEENRITRMTISPSLLERILRTPGIDHRRALRSLRNVTIIGEVVPTALIREFHRMLPQCILTQAYGCAETHDAASRQVEPSILGAFERIATTGGPQVNQRIYVLDEDRKPQPRGVPGELYVGGDSLAIGYFMDEANTAARFVPDPVRPGKGRMFKTGDLGRMLLNGELQVMGRIDSMVKLRGYSIVLSVVEGALLDFPTISNAVVVAAMDQETGRPDHLVAYVVVKKNADWSAGLRPFLQTRLPHYAIPTYVVPLESLPLAVGSNSKVDRRALPKPGPEHRLTTVATKTQPRHELDSAIAAIWRDVLKTENIGIDEDFFELGGHSLLAAEFCGRLNARLGYNLRVADVFQKPTIASLSDILNARTTGRETEAGGPT